jgi:ABC-type hemin transport system substrate-binding protein
MQPPTSNSVPLRIQLAQLKQASVEAVRVKHQSHRDKLRDQIKAWSESMTPEQRNRRFSTEEIERLAGLKGKTGGRTAHHHIAMALREVGLKPYRDWTVAGRNRRYWKIQGET